MSWTFAGIALGVVASLAPLNARGIEADERVQLDSSIVAAEPQIRASLARIAQGSSLWREALDDVRDNAGRILVISSAQLEESNRQRHDLALDPSSVGGVLPMADKNGRVPAVMVIVDLPLLTRVHQAKGSLPAELNSDLDRILIHEVYGHAVPYLVTGDLSGRCADPQADERPSDSCSISRENAVRAELRLGRRVDAGLEGLTLSSRYN